MEGAPAPGGASSEPLFGREEIVAECERLLSEAQAGHGRGLLLAGTEGIGKTYLLGVVCERAARRGFRVLSARGPIAQPPPPFSLVRELFGSATAHEIPAPIDDPRQRLSTAAAAPEGSGELGDSREGADPGGTGGQLVDLDGNIPQLGGRDSESLEASREELLGRIEASLLSIGQKRTLLLAIDDIHLADASSVEFLSRFATDLADLPVAVVATTGTKAEIPYWTRRSLEVLGRSPSFRSTTIPSLTVPDLAGFVDWVVGGPGSDPQDILRWHTLTEGNPRFAQLLVRSAVGSRNPETRRPVPPGQSLPEILGGRFQALGRREQRVLGYAAVLGREFEFALLLSVTAEDEETLTESVDRLVQDGFVREMGREVYRFSTEAFRARVYAELTEIHRRILHEKVGLVLEASGRASDAELARHFDLGHDPERAMRYNLAAAGSATRAFAYEDAATHTARALEAARQCAVRDVTLEIRLLTEEGRLLTELGNAQRSEETLTRAVGLARDSGAPDIELGRALLGLSQSRLLAGEYASAGELADEAWHHLSGSGTKLDLMSAHRASGLAAWRRGDLPLAERHLRTVLEIADQAGTALEQGHALVDLANLTVPMDAASLQRTLDLYDQAAARFALGGSDLAIARVRMNRAVTQWQGGRPEPALREFGLATEAAERAHSARWIGWCQFNLAQLLVELGRTTEARAALERATRVLAPIGDATAEQQLWMTRGMVERAEHAFESAETDYQVSLRMAGEQHFLPDEAEVWFHLAELSRDQGDLEESRRRWLEAKARGILSFRPDFATRAAALEQSFPTPTHVEK